MPLPELDTKRANRLRLACLLVQFALVEWVVQKLLLRTVGWFSMRYQFDPSWLVDATYATSTIRWLLLLAAVWMLTRGLQRFIAQWGGMLIFNYLLVTVLRWLLGVINWLWGRAHGVELVVEPPLQPYFEWIPTWLWFAIWLAMIYGGVKMARDLNARYDGRLLTPRRITALFIAAVVAWLFVLVEQYLLGRVIYWLSFEPQDESGYLRFQAMVTALRLLVWMPSAVFCVLLFMALRKVRRNQRDVEMPHCPKCGYALYGGATLCPECGWTADSS